MSNVKKDAVAPAGAIEKVEIMSADAIQVADYEQTNVKPPRIQQIEQYIQKRKDTLELLEGRIARIEKQRPDLAFKNDAGALNKLDIALAEIKEEAKVTHDKVLGAENELKRETEKWIQHVKAKKIEEMSELKREADILKEETMKHFNAIEKITGQKAHFGGSQESVKEWRLRQQIGFAENYITRVRDGIEKIMN